MDAGPEELGRGVVVDGGRPAPEAWAGAPVVTIDDEVLAAPGAAVGALHEAWAERRPVVVELAVDPARFRAPVGYDGEPHTFGAGHECWYDRLHFLVWANTYDARGGEPIWWWGRKAQRGGATPAASGEGDVVLPGGAPAWIDGGPRGPLPGLLHGAAVVHRETVEAGLLTPQPPPSPPVAVLAADQLAAVDHGAGPARVIAPAGSGKTRVLTERLRHLLAARGYERGGLTAVAYNKKAQLEMAERTAGLGARIETLNAWGYGLLGRHRGRRPTVLEEREVRRVLEGLVPRQQRRVNTDPLARYLEGLSLIRLGLRDPEVVEEQMGDVPGLAGAFGPYRAELARRGVIDFDEQIYGAVEALLHDGAFRRDVQADHRHLLVDEFQDLTPAHVLLVRLVAAPTFDVFGVGDDDQTIYGHAGADPRFLIDFSRFFPGAAAHALEVNYRCPAAVTTAAATLLGYNRRRVPKEIRPGPDASPAPDALLVKPHSTAAGATALVETVTGWLDGSSSAAATGEMAVLTRVRSLLLAPHVALASAGLPVDSIIDADVLDRLGVRAALAYLRIAVAPRDITPTDLVEVHRRPSRGLPQWIDKWLGRCRSIDDVRGAATRIEDPKVSAKLDDLCGTLDLLAGLAESGAGTRKLLTAVRDEVGLGAAMTMLDSTGEAASSHLDDLEALLQVADLHPEPGGFEPWLRSSLRREHQEGGITLSTIHRVKGREWDRVAVFGVTDGLLPHRLAEDAEEERRVLHVAITRGRQAVVVLGDESRLSPFLAELDGSAPAAFEVTPASRAKATAPAGRAAAAVAYRGPAGDPDQVERATTVLRAWRTERARAGKVPPYVVLSDKHLTGIAQALPGDLAALRACPGIGPAKLESYGEEILALVAGATEAE